MNADALREFRVTNLAAAPTVYRRLREIDARAALDKISYTGEPMDPRTWEYVERTLGRTPCSMYGSTEVGVVVASYPGFEDFVPRPGALGKLMALAAKAVLNAPAPLRRAIAQDMERLRGVPMVDTVEQAKTAIAAAYYPPTGNRSVGGSSSPAAVPSGIVTHSRSTLRSW